MNGPDGRSTTSNCFIGRLSAAKFGWMALLGMLVTLTSCGEAQRPRATGTAGGNSGGEDGASGKNGEITPHLVGGRGQGMGGASPSRGGGDGVGLLLSLPSGFSAGEKGGYRVLGPLDGTVPASTGRCGNLLRGVTRDFTSSHPDFEHFLGSLTGIVSTRLGADRKPVYAATEGTAVTAGPTSFNQWYRNTPDANLPFLIDLYLEKNGAVFTFYSSAYFPLDDVGFPERFTVESGTHNFHFTSEFHTEFRYRGGETFSFSGDDDVWVFINGSLAIDLGGVHVEESASVALDDRKADFGLVVGGTYDLALFHAERRTTQSNFRIDTTLDFQDCGHIIDTGVIK